MKNVMLIQISILFVLSVIFYLFAGPALAIIFSIIWIDKALLPLLKFTGNVGFELTTIPVVLIGIIYGPVFGFIFGFLIVALVGGIINIIAWKISPPIGEVQWPPLIPSPDHLADGLVAGLAGLLISFTPLVGVVLVCVIVKSFLLAIKEKLMMGYINYFARVMNIIIDFVIVWYFQDYLFTLLALG